MRKQELMTIVRQQEIAKDIFELVLTGELVKTMKMPGQFINVGLSGAKGTLLRRPISICEIDEGRLELTILYRAGGLGTRYLSMLGAGAVVDILGPLGTGFDVTPIPTDKTVVLVGGGIGVPPMYELAKRLSARGNRVIAVLGFASQEDVFYEEKFAQHCEVHIATMDGTHGFHGHTLALIQEKGIAFDWILACGPTVMLKAIQDTYAHTKQGYLSFEERMACGIGACYACVCDLTDGARGRVCKEGPVFELGAVVI